MEEYSARINRAEGVSKCNFLIALSINAKKPILRRFASAKRAESVSRCNFLVASSIIAKKPILIKKRIRRVGRNKEVASTDGLRPLCSHARIKRAEGVSKCNFLIALSIKAKKPI